MNSLYCYIWVLCSSMSYLRYETTETRRTGGKAFNACFHIVTQLRNYFRVASGVGHTFGLLKLLPKTNNIYLDIILRFSG